MLRKTYRIVALAILAAAIAVPAASAGNGNGKGNGTPTQAQIDSALAAIAANPFSTPVISTFVGQAQKITPQAALAAGQAAGAETSVAPGLTARQAVGLDAIPASTAAQLGLVTGDATATTASAGVTASSKPIGGGGAVTAMSTTCWSDSVSRSWGIWPTSQDLYDDGYWCGYYNGSITYRSQTPHQGGRYCSPAGTWVSTTYWYSGSPIWQYTVGGNWNCLAVNQGQSFHVNMSSSGIMWLG